MFVYYWILRGRENEQLEIIAMIERNNDEVGDWMKVIGEG